MSKDIFVGIDIGSRTAKGVLLKDDEIYTATLPTGLYMQETSEDVYKKLRKTAKLKQAKASYAVFTGYGRIAASFNDVPSKVVTEISCHAMGAHFLNPNTQTVIDIGGQDSKVIKVDRSNGTILDFALNDKCAAGTGKFLETAAVLLGLRIDEIGEVALKSEKPAQISSQCIVFAESEIISLRARGDKRSDIAAGTHLAVARRINNLFSRVGREEDILFTGGVSRNKGAEKALEDTLKVKFSHVDFDTIFAGALGAALYAKNYAIQQGIGTGRQISFASSQIAA